MVWQILPYEKNGAYNMKFTDRFIELPIKIYNEHEKELTGNCEFKDIYLKVLPEEIQQYKPADDEETGITDIVHVRMKGGDTYNVYMDFIQFEDALNKHWDIVRNAKQ